MFDDKAAASSLDCRGGFGAYGGIWTENIVSGISRDILVEAMFRIEAAGYPIVLHIHDEWSARCRSVLAASRNSFDLMTQQPSWAPDLPIAANAWRGYRYDKSEKSASRREPQPGNPPSPLAATGRKPSNGRRRASRRRRRASPNARSAIPRYEADDGHAGISVSFTRFEAHGERLSKLYKQATDGKVFKLGGTQMSRGVYETITIEAANTAAVLAEVGSKIDVLNFREAIGLGMIKDGLPLDGRHHHQGQVREAPGQSALDEGPAIPRALSHFDWPFGELGLLLFDGDEKDDLREILTALWPDFAEVAAWSGRRRRLR